MNEQYDRVLRKQNIVRGSGWFQGSTYIFSLNQYCSHVFRNKFILILILFFICDIIMV